MRRRGGIVSLVDVALLRQAERRRDEALRFLSHDLHAPLASIEALLTLEDAAEASGIARVLPTDDASSLLRRADEALRCARGETDDGVAFEETTQG